MKTTCNLSINNSVNFGAKVAMKQALSLASNRSCYKTQMLESKKTITELTTNKNWENNVSHLVDVFTGMASMLREKFPELSPYVLKIVDPLFSVEHSAGHELNFQNVVKEAEKFLGKEIDIDPKDVDNVLEKLYV